MLSFVDSQMVIPPVLQRFLGCIILGEVPTEVGEAIDNIEEQQVPESILFLMKIWWGRNHAEKALPDVVELLQDSVKDMLS